MKKPRDKDAFIRKPEYPGGRDALQKFLNKNLNYPAEAIENEIEGKVYLTFRVDHGGEVRDILVLKGLGYGCDEEAVRLAGLLKYSPQKNRNTRVSVQHKLTINFALPQKPAAKRTINYTYVEGTGNAGTKKTSYSYTLNIKPRAKPGGE